MPDSWTQLSWGQVEPVFRPLALTGRGRGTAGQEILLACKWKGKESGSYYQRAAEI
jgi:hypothetical protein